MIKDIKPRLYQETIFAKCVDWNTLVVLPTGLGKTTIALMLSSYRLNHFPKSKIIFLAPTRPLVEQHKDFFEKHLDINGLVVFTGKMKPEKRKELWEKSRIIFSTPQCLANDIITNRINLKDVSLIIFDEAQHSVGDYDYVYIAKRYIEEAKFPKILGLTASPGSDIEKIKEVCNNLFIDNVEIRTYDDKDVKPYIKKTSIEWIVVDLPKEFLEIRNLIKLYLKEKINILKEKKVINKVEISKKSLLQLQSELHRRASQGEKDILQYISIIAEIIKMSHALQLIETQGITPLYKYLRKLLNESSTTKVKAVKRIVSDQRFKMALMKATELYEKGIEHPKMEKLKEIIKKEINKDIKIIVFTQFRDSGSKIVGELNKQGIKAKLFVGQMKKKDTGLSQKEQKEIINQFKNKEFNVIVMTSVGEEGLDIPSVDIVIFYEPIPSAIRTIQRRGRTGRQEEGRVIILTTKNTIDENYRWSAFHKEKRMYRNLEKLKKDISINKFLRRTEKTKEQRLDKFIKSNEKKDKKENIKIIADYREKLSPIIEELRLHNVNIEIKKLDIADYLVSDVTAIEIKTIPDFVNSIVDGRLLQQIKELKRNFEKPLLIIEGDEDIYSVRNVHPNAIQGMLATIAIDYSIPIIWTKNKKETANLIYIISKREQEGKNLSFTLHTKKPLTLKEQQEYIISSLPGIGPTLSKPLLKRFGSVKNIINADESELMKINLIGEKKIKNMKNVIDSKYKD